MVKLWRELDFFWHSRWVERLSSAKNLSRENQLRLGVFGDEQMRAWAEGIKQMDEDARQQREEADAGQV